jgi:hypothetical protein
MKIIKIALIAATIAIGGAGAAEAKQWDRDGPYDNGYHRGDRHDHYYGRGYGYRHDNGYHRGWRENRYYHSRYRYDRYRDHHRWG